MSFLAASLAKTEFQTDYKATNIRPAGVTTQFKETAKDALTWSERPQTPEEQKKYRQSTVHEPGKILRHYGTADDKVPDGPFGDKSKFGEGVAQTIKSFPDSEIARWKLERAEDVYASAKQEPLGQGYVRGHNIPEGLGTERAFGMIIDAKGKDAMGQARQVIFPADAEADEDSEAHKLYVASHAAYAPGEQRRRNYNWDATGVDPMSHRFGAVDLNDYRDGVRKAMQPELDQSLQQAPVVASKIHEDFKLATTDKLGTVRKLGAGDRNLPPDHAFGVTSLLNGKREPGVDVLLNGSYTPQQQQPDADLGKSLREGWRNIAPEGKVFGVPSIRTDIALPKAKSVANTINYGNEPDALQLLRPPRSVERGVHEEHYIQLRPRAEVQALVAEAGIELGEDDFAKVFGMAAEADGEAEACCLDTFFRARHHLLAQTIQVPVRF